MRMMALTVLTLVAVSITEYAAAAGGKSKEIDEDGGGGPSTVRTFYGVPFMVTSNAEGNVVGASVQAETMQYGLETDKMSPATLKGLLKFHDKPVELRGEVVMFNDKTAVKVVGTIKDLSSTFLSSALLQVGKDPKGAITGIGIYRGGGGPGAGAYLLVTNKLSASLMKTLVNLDAKHVSITGDISESAKAVSNITSARESRGPSPKK